jgi:hypothetical protein
MITCLFSDCWQTSADRRKLRRNVYAFLATAAAIVVTALVLWGVE